MNQQRQMAIAAGTAVLVTLAFFFVLLKPKMSEVSEVRGQITTAEQEEQVLRNDLARLKGIRRDAPAVIARLEKATGYLPSTPDLPGFIRLIQEAATSSGTDLQSLAPSPPMVMQNATGISVISVTIVGNGGFRRIQDFLGRIEGLKRVVQVQAMSLNPTQDEVTGATVLQATLTLQMYVVGANARLGGAAPSPTPSPSGGVS